MAGRLDEKDQKSRVFVGNVSQDTTAEDIRKKFEVYGPIANVNKNVKGFAFVQFENEPDAKEAVAKENGRLLNGKKIDVKPALFKPSKGGGDHEASKGGAGGSNKSGDHGGRGGHNERRGSSRDREERYGPPSSGDRYGSGSDRDLRGGGGGWGGSDRDYRSGGGYPPQYDGPGRGSGGRDGGYYGGDNGGGSMSGGGGFRGGWDNDGLPGGRGPPKPLMSLGVPQLLRGGGPPAATAAPITEKPNDVEIICLNKHTRAYAEAIEARLKNMGLTVDVLFPNPDIPLGKVLGNIASRGVMYAVCVAPENEVHRSLTVNVLQGEQQEHRNMPLDEAMSFVGKSFSRFIEKPAGGNMGFATASANSAAEQLPAFGHPNDIRTILGFLIDDRPMSIMEYDKLIKYLATRREGTLKAEYGMNIPAHLLLPPVGPMQDPVLKVSTRLSLRCDQKY